MTLTKEMVQEEMKKGAVVVNVLEGKTYNDVHIKGSVNIPLKGKSDDVFALEVQRRFGKDKRIITHCTNSSCTAGPRAAAILKARGFNAEDYPGGMEEWFFAGLPVEGKMPTAHTT
jgi:rhodanese-related sulfurtransferase